MFADNSGANCVWDGLEGGQNRVTGRCPWCSGGSIIGHDGEVPEKEAQIEKKRELWEQIFEFHSHSGMYSAQACTPLRHGTAIKPLSCPAGLSPQFAIVSCCSFRGIVGIQDANPYALEKNRFCGMAYLFSIFTFGGRTAPPDDGVYFTNARMITEIAGDETVGRRRADRLYHCI
ncbi:hypothetical protein DEU56DRAFT_834004 [Suillus clintonianus]|uniref:uncharacterized protein n=1 Tax=Suillus clintonianus TaxID=1904413 RepID=UPI001B868C0A|nr:uncharacterized protein DEU56DRAFT_834004 [Suillus clintonianus]KAG2121604.1 hypothetical protein DEU56DRAFT_834004 [Suillus clintonianus]